MRRVWGAAVRDEAVPHAAPVAGEGEVESESRDFCSPRHCRLSLDGEPISAAAQGVARFHAEPLAALRPSPAGVIPLSPRGEIRFVSEEPGVPPLSAPASRGPSPFATASRSKVLRCCPS